MKRVEVVRMRRQFAIGLWCLVLATAAGCRKKSAPEFYDAQGRYSVLVARLGDDAYAEAEMNSIIETLARVPPAAKEAPQAQTLLGQIRAEKARVDAEHKAKAEALASAEAAPPVVYPDAPTLVGAPSAPATPTEVPLPSPGMKLDDFISNHIQCMDNAPDTEIPGEKKPGRTFSVKKTKACTDRYGGAGDNVHKMYIFIDGKMAAEAIQQDAVQMVQKPAPPPIEIRGPTLSTTPGIPLPTAENPGMPPPDPSTAFAPPSSIPR